MPRSVLVVEDERHIGRLVQVNLERAGYAVVIATDYQSARDQLQTVQPDLVVMDDKLEGTEAFVAWLKENPRTNSIKLINLGDFRRWQQGSFWERLKNLFKRKGGS